MQNNPSHLIKRQRQANYPITEKVFSTICPIREQLTLTHGQQLIADVQKVQDGLQIPCVLAKTESMLGITNTPSQDQVGMV